ncbi:MAG TPA: response regulator [Blastocatellia bacterium]|nr:response regulator [Blastocatellia bacterium]
MSYTILAVDDEPANLRMLERLFRREHRVLTANSGEEALAILQKEQVSLIITDQRMPGMSGTEMLRESMSSSPDSIKIILTGYTDIEALTEAINTSRVYKFVSKPWDPISLKQTVQDAFLQHGMLVRHKQLIDDIVRLVHSYPDIFNQESAQDEVITATTGLRDLCSMVEESAN